MNDFEAATIEVVKGIRTVLAADDDSPNYLEFTVKASGRVRDGELEIKFSLSDMYGANNVSGDSVEAVIAEYLRRIGWQKSHEYLALSAA